MISIARIIEIEPPFIPPFGWLEFNACGCLHIDGMDSGFRASGCIQFDTQDSCAEFMERCGAGAGM